MLNRTRKYSGVFFSVDGPVYVNTSINTKSPFDINVNQCGVIDDSTEASFSQLQEKEKNLFTVATLGKTDYQIIRMEKPNCPKKEIEKEILWSIQDQLLFEDDNLILRWVEAPATSLQQKFIFAVVLDKQRLLQRVSFLKNLNCTIVSVTIPELAKSSLLKQMATKDHFIIYLDIAEELQFLFVTQNGQLIFSKPLPKGFLTSASISDEEIETLTHILEQTTQSLNISKNCKLVLPSYSPCVEALRSNFEFPICTFKTEKYTPAHVEDRSLIPKMFVALGGIFSHVQNR